jgi:UDP-N-acetyl-D-mannosaminuronate dehydrogenase
MPRYVVDTISRAMNEQRRSFNGATILALGVAYQRNINDIRESPALDCISTYALGYEKAQRSFWSPVPLDAERLEQLEA